MRASEAARVRPKRRQFSAWGTVWGLRASVDRSLCGTLAPELPVASESSFLQIKFKDFALAEDCGKSCQGQSKKASEASGLPEWFSSAESAISLPPSLPPQASNLMNNPQVQQL